MTCVPSRSESPALSSRELHARDLGSLSVLSRQPWSCPRNFAFAVALWEALFFHAFAWLAPRYLHPGFSALYQWASHTICSTGKHRVTSNRCALFLQHPCCLK